MRLFGKMSIDQNRLRIGNVDLERLRNEYQTPLIIYDEEGITENIQNFKDNFKSDRFQTRIIYASKAFSSIYILRLIGEAGLFCDVVSGGEIYTAIQAGLDPSTLYFHGNNKTADEISLALEEGLGTFVIDSPEDFDLVERVTRDLGKGARTLLRINPGIEASTHKYIQTTTDDSKFGMSSKDPRTMDLLKRMAQSENLDFGGVHCHIGSQVFDEKFFFEEADLVISFAKKIQRDLGIDLKEINLGGGFGSFYTDEDRAIAYGDFLKSYINIIEERLDVYDLDIETISIEPGRSLINNFGHTLYTVGSVKETPSGLPLVFVDGGMSDNPRYALYNAKYQAVLPMRMDEDSNMESFRIGGKLCESGDILIEEAKIPRPSDNDLLLVPFTGAYTYSMSSNYNMVARPAVVFVKQGNTRLAIKRETYEDMLRNNMR